jgi:hypothetical protein
MLPAWSMPVFTQPNEIPSVNQRYHSADYVASPALITATLSAFERTAALRAAIDLDFFTAVAEGAVTVEALARRCDAAIRGTLAKGLDRTKQSNWVAKFSFRHETISMTAISVIDRSRRTTAGRDRVAIDRNRPRRSKKCN